MLRGLCGVSDTLEECPPTRLRKLPRLSTFPPAGRELGAMQIAAPFSDGSAYFLPVCRAKFRKLL